MYFDSRQRDHLASLTKDLFRSYERKGWNIRSPMPGDGFTQVVNEIHKVVESAACDMGYDGQSVKFEVTNLIFEVYHVHFEDR